VPGLFIVGELGGMGLIRNAVKQGKEAAEAIAGRGRRGGGAVKDAIVVGAGPAGIAATLGLMKAGLSVDLLDGSEYGGTIKHYPRGKIVMNGRLDLPLYGTVRRKVHKKEDLLAVWDDVRAKTGLTVETGITVEGLARTPDGNWTLRTSRGDRQAAHVVLALGRRGSPRKLGVPGEDLEKVAYRLLEPEIFAGKHVLVVGGGNSAVESALALADYGGCASVALSYRRAELARVRRQNRARIDEVIRAGKVKGLMPSEVVSVTAREVSLKAKDVTTSIPNDAIIVQIGGTAPTELLSSFGIALQTKYGEA
jgi:thioredoxin reductase